MRAIVLAAFIPLVLASCGGEAMAPPTVLTGTWAIMDDPCFIAADYGSSAYSTVFSCGVGTGVEIIRGTYEVSGDTLTVVRTAASCPGVPRDGSGQFSVSGDVLTISRPPATVMLKWTRTGSPPDTSRSPVGCWSDDGATFALSPLVGL